jgi:hypothetical protein
VIRDTPQPYRPPVLDGARGIPPLIAVDVDAASLHAAGRDAAIRAGAIPETAREARPSPPHPSDPADWQGLIATRGGGVPRLRQMVPATGSGR